MGSRDWTALRQQRKGRREACSCGERQLCYRCWPVDATKLAAGQGLAGLGSSIKRPETVPGSNSAGGGCLEVRVAARTSRCLVGG
jgi:hypothetical protein